MHHEAATDTTVAAAPAASLLWSPVAATAAAGAADAVCAAAVCDASTGASTGGMPSPSAAAPDSPSDCETLRRSMSYVVGGTPNDAAAAHGALVDAAGERLGVGTRSDARAVDCSATMSAIDSTLMRTDAAVAAAAAAAQASAAAGGGGGGGRGGRSRSGVLVHCSEGKSRSVTLVLAYLMMTQGWNLKQSLQHVRTSRPVACPNAGFMSRLVALDTQLHGKPSLDTADAGLKLKSRKPKSRVCGVCGLSVGVSTASLRVHYKTKHPGVSML